VTAIIFVFAAGTYLFLKTSLLQQIDNHLNRDMATVVRVIANGTQQLDILPPWQLWPDSRGNRQVLVNETDGWMHTGQGIYANPINNIRSGVPRFREANPNVV